MLTAADNKTNVVSTRELAWGTVGENLADQQMTATEALERSGLANWDVRHVPMVTALGSHDQAENDMGLTVADQFATVATINEEPEVLGVVGSRHTVFQNEETVELLDTIVDEGGAHFVAAGSLNRHRKTFTVLKMPQGIQVGGEDASELYLGVTNTHDGTGSLLVWTTAVRLACTNMLNTSIRSAQSKWRLRHTAGMHGKVAEARRSLELTFKWAQEFEVYANGLLDQKFTDREFAALVDHLEPESDSQMAGWVRRQEEKRDTLHDLFATAETNQQGRGTRWAAFNAFTEYADWYLPVRGADAGGQRRASRILDSTSLDNFKQRAFDALVTA